MGTAEQKRRSFGKLIKLLNKLGVTRYVHVPVMSDPYHLEHQDEIDRIIAHFRAIKPKASITDPKKKRKKR